MVLAFPDHQDEGETNKRLAEVSSRALFGAGEYWPQGVVEEELGQAPFLIAINRS